MRVRFTVYLAESLVLSPEQSRSVPKTYPEQQVTQQVTQQVKRLLNIMDGEMSRVELMQSVNLKDRVSFSKNYLEPALDADLIEMTQPDSPKSPTQRYRLTKNGLLKTNEKRSK